MANYRGRDSLHFHIPFTYFGKICIPLFSLQLWLNRTNWFFNLSMRINQGEGKHWNSDLTDKMKRSFFQAAVVSILLYGCTTWTLTKRLEKKLDGNCTKMLRAILNKSWRQHPTRHQLCGHLPPITKTIQVRRTRHAGRTHKWCTLMDPHT